MSHQPDAITRLSRSCDPDTPLKPGDSRYVDLAGARGEKGNGWRERLARSLRHSESGRAQTNLVAGFLGDGKTTELQRLQNELVVHPESRLAVVYVNASEYLNMYEYSFNEILLAVISETGRQLSKDPYNIPIQPSFFTKRIHEVTTKLLSKVELKKLGVKVGKDVFEMSADLALRARDSDTIRRKLWDALRADHTTLSREFADLIGTKVRPALKDKGYQDLVIIVDWLEKLVDSPIADNPSLGMHRALFLHHAQAFKSWDAQIVLTVPIDLIYSAEQANLRQAYGCDPIVINEVNVAPFLEHHSQNRAMEHMREVLRLRAEEAPDGGVPFDDVFESRDLADELIRFSGGHLRSLMILMRQCCSFCDALPITRAAVDAAKREERLAAGRKVKESWFPKLAKVHKTHEVPLDPDHFEMLRSLCILAYANGESLYGVDPAIVELKQFQHELAKLQ